MADNGDVFIRKAESADVDYATDVIYLASPDLFDYLYEAAGNSAREFIRRGFSSNRGFLGYQLHWVATIDDKLVGTIASWSDQIFDRLVEEDEALVHEFYDEEDAKAALSKYTHADSLIPPFGKNAVYVADMAVEPAHHRSGIGTQLLAHVIDQVKSQGIPRVVLDVYAENQPAIGLYEKHGFVATSLNRCSDPSANLPDTRRMVLEIDPGKAD